MPKAVADLKATSESLRDISTLVDMVSNIGLILLVVGILLAASYFVQSLGALPFTGSLSLDPDIATTTVIINS